ncbi:sensor histidine kinase [Sphingobacterium cellulitidis]|uniref:histidine kinase n=1 Tax=Sphingobacterium cellulitidis TaxID=1768011 RepID=A0A8H9FZH8_9SPHI|nr:sensor histidine kinase [Sphingobacterium soli]MBA8986174.1 signal transduction histidine kinase [Sphingobacterium soli]GGE18225.1 hypothetical protein GCM10011516_14820 [Sphingobacterium soli]
MKTVEKVSFSVDAGIINRLGLELVAKSETAVAELIKNAYDADATIVNLYFENAEIPGGSLTIEDDGVGMNKKQLIDGFMRLATTDKIHNSISDKYSRPKAGRKGIGRFSTQRLGTYLDVITLAEGSDNTIQLSIDWNRYITDEEINEIQNDLIDGLEHREKGNGTTLIISNLRDKWSDADVKRVYRYVADLIQPNFLKITAGSLVEESKKEGFEVNFYRKNIYDNDWRSVADPNLMMLDRALATFSGYIDEEGYGKCVIESKSFTFSGIKEKLYDMMDVSGVPFELLKGSKIAFKVYYFIGGDRKSYYGINQMELNSIIDHLDKNGGVKLYRNGFRVPKYGDLDNDWLNIDKNSRVGKGIPFNNNRVLGFVQLVDPDGRVFEESAGREGLIEKEAFAELQSFVSESVKEAFRNFTSWFRNSDEYKLHNPDKKPTPTSDSLKRQTRDLKEAVKVLSNPDSDESEKNEAILLLEQTSKSIISHSEAAINELEMMRVLAGTGLTIAEFVHEIKQIVPSTKGYIDDTLKKGLSSDVEKNLLSIKELLTSLESYTSYFDESISKNVVRQLVPIDIRVAVKAFVKVVASDLERRNIDIELQMKGKDLFTTPMHPSEWNTLLQNLYSNSKKAILRSGVERGKILVKGIRDDENGVIIFEFLDNGSGITEKDRNRIFDAFFTTSKENKEDWGTGTGLGLFILNQMIRNRNGAITLGMVDPDYKTNIRIEIPITKKEELKRYGY